MILKSFVGCKLFSSVAQSCPTLCDPMDYSTPGPPGHHQLPESTQTHVHWVGDAIQPSHPLSSPSLPALIFPTIRVFLNKSAFRIRWPKYWSFSFSISPSNEYSGLISFRMDWLDLLAVQGTLKSLLQHHSSKPSVLWHSAFFMVQFSHPYMTTGKTTALTRWTMDLDKWWWTHVWGVCVCVHVCVSVSNDSTSGQPHLLSSQVWLRYTRPQN